MSNQLISHSTTHMLKIGLLALLLGVLPPVLWGAFSALPSWQAQPPAQGTLSLGEQGVLVIAVYAIKLVYMLLALAAVALTWGERGRAWLALRGSLAAFWLGEAFCAINILFYVEENLLYEYLHSLFMVFCIGLLFYSLVEAADRTVLHYTDPKARCALAGVCHDCVKATSEKPGTCLLRCLFQWMIPLAAVLAFMPLTARPLDFSFETRVFGIPRILTHLMPIQWYELRFSPWASLIILASAWFALTWRGGTPAGVQTSKILLAFSAGHLGFSFMRLTFAAFYQEGLVWFFFWEEMTELLLVIGVLVVVLLVRPVQTRRILARFKGGQHVSSPVHHR